MYENASESVLCKNAPVTNVQHLNYPPKRPVDVKQGKMNMSTAPKLDLKTWNFDLNSEPQKQHSVYFVVMPHK